MVYMPPIVLVQYNKRCFGTHRAISFHEEKSNVVVFLLLFGVLGASQHSRLIVLSFTHYFQALQLLRPGCSPVFCSSSELLLVSSTIHCNTHLYCTLVTLYTVYSIAKLSTLCKQCIFLPASVFSFVSCSTMKT